MSPRAGAVLLLLAGCSSTSPATEYSLELDPAFDADHVTAVLASARRWELAAAAAHAPLSLRPVIGGGSGGDHTIRVHRASYAEIDAIGGAPRLAGTTRYYASSDTADVWVTGDLPEPLDHELGHAMGLVHTGEGTVMCRDTGCAASQVTVLDGVQYAATR